MNWAKYREHNTVLDSMVYFTSCQIATYHYVLGVKRTPKCELSQQKSIAEKMIAACEKYGVEAETVDYLKRQMEESHE